MSVCKLQNNKSVFKIRKVLAKKKVKHNSKVLDDRNSYTYCSVFPNSEKMERAFRVLFNNDKV